jgi:hypothetical protein
MRKILLLFVLISNSSFAQKLNDYKYVIIPSKFSFVEEINQYRLNTLTKAAFENIGFVAFYDSDILPDEVANSNCNKVYADVINSSGMFMTKLNLIIKDCKNVVVYSAPIGKSREKDYKTAYVDALLESLRNLKTLNYKYNPKSAEIFEKVSQKSTEINQNVANMIVMPFHATKTENGYKLFPTDGESSKFIILQTSNPNIFIANKLDSSNLMGVLIHKINDLYSLEYYKEGKLITESMSIIF